MKYQFGNRKISIPDDEIEKYQKKYDLSQQEAINLWLEDKELETNDEIEELTEKSKNMTRTIHDARTVSRDKGNNQKKPREKKRDATKEEIIKKLSESLEVLGCNNIIIENPSKIIRFTIREDEYKLDLTRKNKALAEKKAKR